MKKFDFCIGNPPYQIDQNGRTLPVYNNFMDAAYEVANVTELITPARFLFNAGQTHKSWNKKMLSDEHLTVLAYSPTSDSYFNGVDIKGGVAITLRDKNRKYGAIDTFVPYPEMQKVLSKVKQDVNFTPLTNIVFTSSKYALANIYRDHPDYRKFVKHKGKDSQIDTNAFEKMPIFKKEPVLDTEEKYIQLYGRANGKRAFYWTKSKYISDPGNLYKYKVFVAAVNGSGDFGIPLSSPVIGKPEVGSTQSFLGIGNFDTEIEAENLLKYLKGKFSRALLCTLKITHHNGPTTWTNIPLQDFTTNSDLAWSKTIHEIDLQLYKKYTLSKEEIDFIEKNVKEMN